MRRLILLLSPISLFACYSAYAQGYAQPPTPRAAQPPPAYQGGQAIGGQGALNPENCGTPDEPKPCPPMPRHPLPYYPANRQ